MFKSKKDQSVQIEETKKDKLTRLIKAYKWEDYYILDDENAIAIRKNVEEEDDNYYKMIHYRVKDDLLEFVKSWPCRQYYFGLSLKEVTIQGTTLFKVQDVAGEYSALYDYQKGEFVIKPHVWKKLEFGRDNTYFEKYNGVIGVLEFSSDYEPTDTYTYTNALTGQSEVASHCVYDGYYFGIIDLDGTIRENKLFKGRRFSQITKIIDLDEYNSLDEFKEEKKQECNAKKAEKIDKYLRKIEKRQEESLSPYLDYEVSRIIRLKQPNNK